MFKEIGFYLAGLGLVVACYVGGNLIAGLLWGVSADYAGWFGPLRAAIFTVPGLVAYYIFAPQIRFMEHRHFALPPILVGVCGLCVVGVVFALAYSQGVYARAVSMEMVSGIIPFAGWAGFGFWLLARPRESLT